MPNRPKIIGTISILVAVILVAGGAYWAGHNAPKSPAQTPTPANEVLGIESSPFPTEIPSLADESTPSSTPRLLHSRGEED